jgi:uncharacterized protein with FMN-binding domain
VRVRSFFVAAAASGAVVLIGWEMGAQHATPMIASSTTTSSAQAAPSTQAASPASPSPSAVPAPTTSASAGGTAPASSGGTFAGAVVQHPYGTVQVTVTIAGGKLTDAKVQMTESDGHSQRIDDYAAPILRSSVLSAQSAKVNSVSGATYTSDAYLQSLQSALDKAHFAG